MDMCSLVSQYEAINTKKNVVTGKNKTKTHQKRNWI